MSPLSRQFTGISTPFCLVPLKSRRLRWSKIRRRLVVFATSQDAIKIHSKFDPKDVERICNQGPSLEDLRETHSVVRSDGSGNLFDEKISFIREHTLGEGMYAREPHWGKLRQIPYMQFHKGIEERNWKSPYFEPNSKPWKILFYEDCGRLFRPSFQGYRALVIEGENENTFWVDLRYAGTDLFQEDYIFEREGTDLPPIYRAPLPRMPHHYGYHEIFTRLGYALRQKLPKELEESYAEKHYLKKKDVHLLEMPSRDLLDISFHMTNTEPSLHGLWQVIPQVMVAGFVFSFLGVCLFFGVFKPKKQMPSDPMQAMEFAQSKGRARKDGRTGVRFSDIAGLDNILLDLKELVDFLKEPMRYRVLNAKPPKGLLLDGPPGTGKTLIAKAVAGEAGVPFYQMSGSEFVEAIVGVGAARVRDLFKRARAQGEACIIFVDEIDALGTKRAEAGIMTNEEREQTLNQLLTEMDGFSSEMGVVFIAATNRADLLDPALTRPGRFDRKVRVIKPDTESRYRILQLHAKKHKISDEVDLLQLARDLPGLSGADLSNILNESALEAIREEEDLITPKHVYGAVDRVLHGIKDPIQPHTLTLGRVFAVHEMGRAIVAMVLRERTGRLEAVEKLSIVSRGGEKTRTVFFRGKDEDYTMTTRSRMLERIAVILAGRAAEHHFFGEPTTYGAKDLGPAFRLAEKVVANYALTEIGLTSYAPVALSNENRRTFEVTVDNIDEDLFGRGVQGGMFQPSDASLHKILTKCYAILWEMYQECLDIFSSYSNALEAGSKRLLEELELTGDEVQKIIHQYPPRPLKKPAPPDFYEIYAPQIPSPLSTKQEEEEDVEIEEEIETRIPETVYR